MYPNRSITTDLKARPPLDRQPTWFSARRHGLPIISTALTTRRYGILFNDVHFRPNMGSKMPIQLRTKLSETPDRTARRNNKINDLMLAFQPQSYESDWKRGLQTRIDIIVETGRSRCRAALG